MAHRRFVLEAEVTSLAPGGNGVAHVEIGGERRAVFVPLAAPADRARIEVDAASRPARGRIVELLQPSRDRAEPACAWSKRCGGCDWMHLSVEAQARAHEGHVRDALPAEWRGVKIAVRAAPEAIGWRARARVHVVAEHGHAAVGMNEAKTHAPVEVDACVVLRPAIERARRSIPALLEGARGRGDAQIAIGSGGLPVVDLSWQGDLAPACFARIEAAVSAGEIAGARVSIDGSSRPATIGDPTPWMTGADGAPLRLAPGGFGQANEQVNAALARHVADAARACGADKAVELFAGAGNLTVMIAREVRGLVAVESSRDACAAARTNVAARAIANTRVVEADAAAYAWSPATRLVVLDPPRTGARAVAERLAASPVKHVVYVSCDARTLARDLALLAPRYAPRSVATFEMFPQTSHVEAVVVLVKNR